MPVWALAPVASYLRQSQHDDGGWTFSATATPVAKAEASEPDMTGAAIAALCETGVPPYDPDLAAALAYLHGLLVDSTGAIHYAFGDNSDANAWAVSGLSACGIDPQSAAWTTPSGKTPIDHLLSLQLQSGPEEGGFGYADTSEANLYSTQDALRAIAGGVFTAAPAIRSNPSDPSVRPAPTVAEGTPVPHLLAIELAPGNVRMCKVTAAAGAALMEVLSAAKAGSKPAGCVTSFTVSGGVSPRSTASPRPAKTRPGCCVSTAAARRSPANSRSDFGDAIALRLGGEPQWRGSSRRHRSPGRQDHLDRLDQPARWDRPAPLDRPENQGRPGSAGQGSPGPQRPHRLPAPGPASEGRPGFAAASRTARPSEAAEASSAGGRLCRVQPLGAVAEVDVTSHPARAAPIRCLSPRLRWRHGL